VTSGTNLNLTNPVTLNLFQGPSLRKPGARGRKQAEGLGAYLANTALAARWTLKQVQGDDGFYDIVSGAFRG
jgi:hypothetical protein